MNSLNKKLLESFDSLDSYALDESHISMGSGKDRNADINSIKNAAREIKKRLRSEGVATEHRLLSMKTTHSWSDVFYVEIEIFRTIYDEERISIDKVRKIVESVLSDLDISLSSLSIESSGKVVTITLFSTTPVHPDEVEELDESVKYDYIILSKNETGEDEDREVDVKTVGSADEFWQAIESGEIVPGDKLINRTSSPLAYVELLGTNRDLNRILIWDRDDRSNPKDREEYVVFEEPRFAEEYVDAYDKRWYKKQSEGKKALNDPTTFDDDSDPDYDKDADETDYGKEWDAEATERFEDRYMNGGNGTTFNEMEARDLSKDLFGDLADDRMKEKEKDLEKDLQYCRDIMAGKTVIDDKYHEELGLNTAKAWLKKDYVYVNGLSVYSPDEIDKRLAKEYPDIFGINEADEGKLWGIWKRSSASDNGNALDSLKSKSFEELKVLVPKLNITRYTTIWTLPEYQDQFMSGYKEALNGEYKADWDKIHDLEARFKSLAMERYLARRGPSDSEKEDEAYYYGLKLGAILLDEIRSDRFVSKLNSLTEIEEVKDER